MDQSPFLNKRIPTPVGILIIILFTFLAGGILAWQYWWVPEIPEQKCDWRPTKYYGGCELVLGVYYNGERCVWISGCSPEGDIIPFQTMEECKTLCEQDKTANWKTYRNEEYGFEVKYPKDWSVRGQNRYIFFTHPVFDEGFNIEIIDNPQRFTIEEWLDIEERFDPVQPETMIVISKKQLTVDVLSGIDTQQTGPGGFRLRVVYFAKDDKIYSITYVMDTLSFQGNEVLFQEYLLICEQAVKTFQFIK